MATLPVQVRPGSFADGQSTSASAPIPQGRFSTGQDHHAVHAADVAGSFAAGQAATTLGLLPRGRFSTGQEARRHTPAEAARVLVR